MQSQKTSSDLALLVARIAMSALFIPGGLHKLMDLGAFDAMLHKQGVPLADLLAPVGACVEFLGGIAVLVGLQLRIATLLMILFTIIASFIAHRFWELEGPARQMQQTNFFKNLAIVGGFCALWAAGAGRYAVDRWLHRERFERRSGERRSGARSVPHATS
ncbi:MAG TPA: DoxX family protein [Burkholderiales bacterium]|jgi:putative oxidoreductase